MSSEPVERPSFGRVWTGAPPLFSSEPVAIVAAHPDDETLFASFILGHSKVGVVWHLTDGSPYDPALRTVPLSRAVYARMRRKELLASLRHVNMEPRRLRSLGAVDQEAVRSLAVLAERLRFGLLRVVPRVLVTHAYEGAHPDHDAAAFVCWAACACLRRDGLATPQLWEMASYHESGGQLVKSEFSASAGVDEYMIALDAEDLDRKRSMLACFPSQAAVISQLNSDVERVRRAPTYDFGKPPCPRPLHYERLDWPLDFDEFRDLARAAMRQLGLSPSS